MTMISLNWFLNEKNEFWQNFEMTMTSLNWMVFCLVGIDNLSVHFLMKKSFWFLRINWDFQLFPIWKRLNSWNSWIFLWINTKILNAVAGGWERTGTQWRRRNLFKNMQIIRIKILTRFLELIKILIWSTAHFWLVLR